MPGRWRYALAAVVFIAGVALAVFRLETRLPALEDELPRFVFPGSLEIDLPAPGSYTIFHDSESVVDGRYYQAAAISGLRLALQSAATGAPVALVVPGVTTRYAFAGRSGVSIVTFDVTDPGRYRLPADYDTGRPSPDVVLAVGRGFVGKLTMMILSVMGIGLGATGIAITIAVVTLLQRRQARRQATALKTWG